LCHEPTEREYTGVLRYPVNQRIQLSDLNGATSSRESVYFYDKTLGIWMYYFVEENTLKRAYVQDNQLLQQEYHYQDRRFLPPTAYTNATVLPGLLHLNSTIEAETQEDWRENHPIEELANHPDVSSYQMIPYMKDLLFAYVEKELQTIKQNAENEAAYLAQLDILINDALLPRSIISLGRPFTSTGSIRFQSIFQFIALILTQECARYGKNASIPAMGNDFEITNIDDTDHDFIHSLVILLTNPYNMPPLNLIQIDRMIRALENDPSFANEMKKLNPDCRLKILPQR
jgi:hypothetical protein